MMRNIVLCFSVSFLLLLTACVIGPPPPIPPSHALDASTQLVLVTTTNWNSVPGTLQRFARANTESPWTPVSAPIPIVVGRNGLGWGLGLHPEVELPGPVKQEGDGKSPAGIFRLSSEFGLEDADKMKFLKMPYLPLSDYIECVDDVNSRYYNSIVSRKAVPQVDWNSSEKIRTVGQYRLGVVVDHNVDPHLPGAGSCIFMHIWTDAHTGTSGCTAMSSENIDVFAPWLDATAHPVLVQLTREDYQLLKTAWRLP